MCCYEPTHDTHSLTTTLLMGRSLDITQPKCCHLCTASEPLQIHTWCDSEFVCRYALARTL